MIYLPTRDTTASNTNVLKNETNQIRLPVLKAVLIQHLKPTLNSRHTGIQRPLKVITSNLLSTVDTQAYNAP